MKRESTKYDVATSELLYRLCLIIDAICLLNKKELGKNKYVQVRIFVPLGSVKIGVYPSAPLRTVSAFISGSKSVDGVLLLSNGLDDGLSGLGDGGAVGVVPVQLGVGGLGSVQVFQTA